MQGQRAVVARERGRALHEEGVEPVEGAGVMRSPSLAPPIVRVVVPSG